MHALTHLYLVDGPAARQQVLEAVSMARGNWSEAARILAIPYRSLYRLMMRMGILAEVHKVASQYGYNPGHPGVVARGLDPCAEKPPKRPRGRPRKQG